VVVRVSARRAWVIKVGGALCEEEIPRRRLAESCALLERPLVVVHGGGRQVTGLQKRLGIEPRFIDGRRITGPEDLGHVEMALCGTVNKALVRDLIAAGRRAVGVSGCDGAMVRCERIPELGLVGRPAVVDPALLRDLLASGYTPVVAPISLGPSGEAVNVNADEVACALAMAMGAERLLLLSDVAGVILDGAPLAGMEAGRLAEYLESGQITGGMAPKLRAASRAAGGGVGEVVIGGFAGGCLMSVGGTRVFAGEEEIHD
jgi:acetylglutamate kinase